MKLKLSVFILAFIVFNSIIQVAALEVPAIKEVILNSYSHFEGNSAHVTISAEVENLTQPAEMTARLVNGSGQTLEKDVTVNPPVLASNGTAKLELTIPDDIGAGSYKIKVIMTVSSLFSSQTYEKSVSYTIYPASGGTSGGSTSGNYEAPAPVITGISTGNAVLVQGVVSGEITISGNYFSNTASENSVELINNGTGQAFGSALTPKTASVTALTVNVPSGITSGTYVVSVTVNSKSVKSVVQFVVAPPGPVLDGFSVSANANLTAGAINATITITGSNLKSATGNHSCQIIGSNGLVAGNFSGADFSESQIIASIPNSLGAGSYYIKVIVDGKSALSKSTFTINSSLAESLEITGITTPDAILIAGAISGDIIITGKGFSPNPSVELLSQNESAAVNARVKSWTKSQIICAIPAELGKGSYGVRVKVASESSTSSGYIVISGTADNVEGGSGGTGGAGGSGGGGGGIGSDVTISPETLEKVNELTEAAKLLVESEDAAEILSDAKKLIDDSFVFIDSAKAAGNSTDEVEAVLLKIANTAIDKVNSESFSTQVAEGVANVIVNQQAAQMLITKINNIVETANQLNKSLNGAGAGVKVEAVLKLNLASTETVNAVNISLPASVLKEASDKGIEKIVISSGVASVSIVPGFVSMENAGNVELKSERLEAGKLEEHIRKAVGNDAVYDFNLLVDGEKAGKFDKAVEVSVPYQLKQGDDPKRLTVFYINDKGILENVIGIYDSIEKTVRFTTDHFSRYVVRNNVITFNDTGKHKWAEEYIGVMASKGILNGVGGGGFNPSANLTRAEFITIVTRALKLVDDGAVSSFSDVSKGAWYYKYISSAVKAGIVSGRPDGTFAPGDKISRQDMAVILSNTLVKVRGKELPGNSDEILQKFADRNEISNYAKKPVSLVFKHSIITGKPGGLFDPKASASRAEAAVVIYRLFFLE